MSPSTAADRLGRAVVFLFFVLAGLVLDGGLAVRITLMAVAGYLGGVAVMAARRPQAPAHPPTCGCCGGGSFHCGSRRISASGMHGRGWAGCDGHDTRPTAAPGTSIDG